MRPEPSRAAVHIALEPPDQPEVISLIDALDAHQHALYPPESHYGVDIPALSQPQVLFAVARNSSAVAIACGAMLLRREYGEIKRMFVRPSARGQGIAKALLAFLEAQAMARGYKAFKLETGVLQPEAIGLYECAGYQRGGAFGDYPPDPYSVYLHKQA